MVKRSLFWGQAAGKLGEAVYYRAGGEQRTRTYIKNIKNPKTQAQAIQRAKLNNLTACFRGASIFLRSSSERRKRTNRPLMPLSRRIAKRTNMSLTTPW